MGEQDDMATGGRVEPGAAPLIGGGECPGLSQALEAVVEQLGMHFEVTMPPPAEPLTVETIREAIQRIEDSQPRVICSPATADRLRPAGLPAVIIENEHVGEGVVYVFRPADEDWRHA